MRPRPNILLIRLLLIDGAFILAHLIHHYTDALPRTFFSIARDCGGGEWFQYIKELWILLLLLRLAKQRANGVYRGWAFLFGYLLLDDSCRIHERIGYLVNAFFELSRLGFLPPQAKGEMIVSLFVGTLFLLLIGTQYYRSDHTGRCVSHRLAAIVVALALFGVVVDGIVSAVWGSVFGQPLSTVEDGGEMLVMTVALWYVYGLASRNETAIE